MVLATARASAGLEYITTLLLVDQMSADAMGISASV